MDKILRFAGILVVSGWLLGVAIALATTLFHQPGEEHLLQYPIPWFHWLAYGTMLFVIAACEKYLTEGRSRWAT